MLYQKLLMGETPYRFCCGYHEEISSFQEHRHPEAEFIYCKSGSFKVLIEKQSYTVTAGQLVLIAPMEAHELIYDTSRFTAVIEVGPALLRNSFNAFSGGSFSSSVKNLDQSNKTLIALMETIEETILLYNSKSEFSQLFITGNIYKICGYILSEFAQVCDAPTKALKSVANIEKALDMIRNRYAEPLTVDMAAEITGYAKSNFCKIFKSITGETFHQTLNRQRVEIACIYLDATNMSISEISAKVGFSEAKCFCRVFKAITGMTPGERKRKSAHKLLF